MANNISQTTPTSKAMQIHRLLKASGYDDRAADEAVFGSTGIAPRDNTVRTGGKRAYNYFDLRELGAIGDSHRILTDLRDSEIDGASLSTVADSVDQDAFAHAMSGEGGRSFAEYMMDARIAWRDWRTNTAIKLTQIANDLGSIMDPNQVSGLDATMGVLGHLGTAGQVMMGAADPASRPQQFTYGRMSGESVGTARRRLYPKVVIQDEYGNERVTTPLVEMMDYVFSRDENAFETSDQRLASLTAANEAHYVEGDFLEFKDVVDSWFGEENMDQYYMEQLDRGFLGKIAMGTLATGYGLAEVFLDPLVIFERLPVAAMAGLRRLPSSTAKTLRTAEKANKTQTGIDLGDALTAARKHLDVAAHHHRMENSPGTAKRLQQAMRNVAERQDDISRYRVVGESDTFVHHGVPRTNPDVLETSPVETTTFRATKSAPPVRYANNMSRRKLIRLRNKWLDGMAADRKAGMFEEKAGGIEWENYYKKYVEHFDWLLEKWDEGYRPTKFIEPDTDPGVPKHLRGFQRDLVQMRKAMVFERDAASRDREKELIDGINKLDEYLLALEQKRDGEVPRLVEFTHNYKRARTVDELYYAQMQDRLDTAARPHTHYTPYVADSKQLSLFDPAEIEMRAVHGADAAEYAGQGLARLADGATIDDITLPLVSSPNYRAMTGGRILPGVTNQGWIDPDHVRGSMEKAAKNLKTKTALTIKDSGGVERHTTPRTSNMVLLAIEKFVDDMKKAPVGDKNNIKFDDSWLPAPPKSNQGLMESGWYDAYGKTFFDRISPGLYGTWQVPVPSLVRSGLMFIREPMRVMESVDRGKSWNILRGAMYNTEAETSRLKTVFSQALEDFGAIKTMEPPRVRKILETDPPRTKTKYASEDEQLFEILDTARGTDEYAELTANLTEKQLAAVSAIRNELDLLASRLGITGTDKFIDGYVPHCFDADWFSKGGAPPEFQGLSRNGNVFLAHLLKRDGGEGYKRSAIDALDIYSRGVARKLHMEPGMKAIKARADYIAATTNNHAYAAYVDLLMSQLKGEPSIVGRFVDHVIGGIRRTSGKPYQPGAAGRTLMGVTSLVYSSLLTGNRRYPIMNLATNIATSGAEFGLFRSIRGMLTYATPEGQRIFREVGGDKMFLKIFEDDSPMSRLARAATGARVGSPSIQDTEMFIRGTTFWASIDLSLNKLGYKSIIEAHQDGMANKIMFDALRRTEEVNHFFGLAAKPPAFARFSKSISATATQFQSFGPKQLEQLVSMAGDNPGKIGSYLMLSGWLSRVAATELGIDIQDYTGFGFTADWGTREYTSPGVEALARGAVAMANLTRLGFFEGDPVETQKSIDDFGKSLENLISLANAARSHAKTVEAMDTGRVGIPGVGESRPVDMEIANIAGVEIPYNTGPKGQRGEGVAFMLGARSMEQRRHEDARKEISSALRTATMERMALIEKAYQALRNNDYEGMQAQLQRMVDMGIVMGDITDPVVARKETETLYWYYLRLKNNPGAINQIAPILQEHGIIGGQP